MSAYRSLRTQGRVHSLLQVYAVPSLKRLASIPAQDALKGCIWTPPQDSVHKVGVVFIACGLRTRRALVLGHPKGKQMNTDSCQALRQACIGAGASEGQANEH